MHGPAFRRHGHLRRPSPPDGDELGRGSQSERLGALEVEDRRDVVQLVERRRGALRRDGSARNRDAHRGHRLLGLGVGVLPSRLLRGPPQSAHGVSKHPSRNDGVRGTGPRESGSGPRERASGKGAPGSGKGAPGSGKGDSGSGSGSTPRRTAGISSEFFQGGCRGDAQARARSPGPNPHPAALAPQPRFPGPGPRGRHPVHGPASRPRRHVARGFTRAPPAWRGSAYAVATCPLSTASPSIQAGMNACGEPSRGIGRGAAGRGIRGRAKGNGMRGRERGRGPRDRERGRGWGASAR